MAVLVGAVELSEDGTLIKPTKPRTPKSLEERLHGVLDPIKIAKRTREFKEEMRSFEPAMKTYNEVLYPAYRAEYLGGVTGERCMGSARASTTIHHF